MANPTVSAVLDKAAYAPGETARLTVSYADADNQTDSITITGTDEAGQAATVTVVLTERDAVTLTVVDDSGRTWTKQSDNGQNAVFTATV